MAAVTKIEHRVKWPKMDYNSETLTDRENMITE